LFDKASEPLFRTKRQDGSRETSCSPTQPEDRAGRRAPRDAGQIGVQKPCTEIGPHPKETEEARERPTGVVNKVFEEMDLDPLRPKRPEVRFELTAVKAGPDIMTPWMPVSKSLFFLGNRPTEVAIWLQTLSDSHEKVRVRALNRVPEHRNEPDVGDVVVNALTSSRVPEICGGDFSHRSLSRYCVEKPRVVLEPSDTPSSARRGIVFHALESKEIGLLSLGNKDVTVSSQNMMQRRSRASSGTDYEKVRQRHRYRIAST
jgi:hypothetical protein